MPTQQQVFLDCCNAVIVRSCPVHLSEALGGGHARPSGCHILLNVALTPKYPFKRREVVVFFYICWQIDNNE